MLQSSNGSAKSSVCVGVFIVFVPGRRIRRRIRQRIGRWIGQPIRRRIGRVLSPLFIVCMFVGVFIVFVPDRRDRPSHLFMVYVLGQRDGRLEL